jgi:hypothetical protein
VITIGQDPEPVPSVTYNHKSTFMLSYFLAVFQEFSPQSSARILLLTHPKENSQPIAKS